MSEKIVFLITHGTNDPEHVTIPFVMATAALASDVEAVIGLQADAVWLGTRGGGDSVEADGFPPLAKLMADYRELGGKLLICNPCMKARKIDPETQLTDNSEVVAAGRFVAEVTAAKNVLTY